MRLEVSAQDQDGSRLFRESKVYQQIPLNTAGYMYYGAWRAREYLDLSLIPWESQVERFLMHFGHTTSTARVQVKVLYCLNPKECETVHRATRVLTYP